MHGGIGFTFNLQSLVRAQAIPTTHGIAPHGNVPDQSDVCLLIIDMINPFAFEGAEEMLTGAAVS
jgi:hypothetical protein